MMLLPLTLHQTPATPREVPVRRREAGMRKPVKMTLVKAGGRVFPIPLNAQAVVISMAIKSWE